MDCVTEKLLHNFPAAITFFGIHSQKLGEKSSLLHHISNSSIIYYIVPYSLIQPSETQTSLPFLYARVEHVMSNSECILDSPLL